MLIDLLLPYKQTWSAYEYVRKIEFPDFLLKERSNLALLAINFLVNFPEIPNFVIDRQNLTPHAHTSVVAVCKASLLT